MQQPLHRQSRTYQALGYAGVLPFVACGLLAIAGVDYLPGLGAVSRIAASYGLAIICFIAGIHWGCYLYRAKETSLNLFIWSNAITLIAWFSFLLAATWLCLTILACSFAALLIIDLRLRGEGLLTGHYVAMRSNLSAIAIVALLVTAWLA